jgi:hypothetical protein
VSNREPPPQNSPHLLLTVLRQKPALQKWKIETHRQRREDSFGIVCPRQSHISRLESVDGGEGPVEEEVERCGDAQTFSLGKDAEEERSMRVLDEVRQGGGETYS